MFACLSVCAGVLLSHLEQVFITVNKLSELYIARVCKRNAKNRNGNEETFDRNFQPFSGWCVACASTRKFNFFGRCVCRLFWKIPDTRNSTKKLQTHAKRAKLFVMNGSMANSAFSIRVNSYPWTLTFAPTIVEIVLALIYGLVLR